MTAQRARHPHRRDLPRSAADLISATATPLLDATIGPGRRRELLDSAAALLPFRRADRVDDFAGWTATEFLAYAADPERERPRRAGRDTATWINALAGRLPLPAVPLARAITDFAPPTGSPVNPTMRDVVERYLPDTLSVYTSSGIGAPAPGAATVGGTRTKAGELLLAQLELLHDVAIDIRRAEAEHNERDLQIQEAFLKERFSDLSPGQLDLSAPLPQTSQEALDAEVDERLRALTAPGPGRPSSRTGSGRSSARRHPPAPTSGRVPVDAERHPVFVLDGTGKDRRLDIRLALPKGQQATLGALVETRTGATGFQQRTNRRFLPVVHPTAFRASQVDLRLRVDLAGVRRFLVYAQAGVGPEPTSTVLFVRDGEKAQADMATVLARHPRASTTVVLAGYHLGDRIVLRNESTLFPHLRAACTGYGYTQVTWLDDHSPIV